MSSISQLSEQAEVSSSDQFPIYSTTNGQPRRVSANALVTFVQDNLDSDTPDPFRLLSATVATLNADYPAASWTGAVAYCTNGDTGSPCLAVSNGTTWRRVALGATIAA